MNNLPDYLQGVITQLQAMVPGFVSALAVLIIGWFVAYIIRGIVFRLLKRTDLDNRLAKNANMSVSIENFIAKLVYYLILIIVFMIVLEMMGVHNVLAPLQNMVNDFFNFVPNLVGAGIIGFVGYMIATIASEFMGFAGNTLEKYSGKLGISSGLDLGKIVKQLVFIIVFIPILIIALDALQIDAIADPAKEMLSTFLNAIPQIIVAVIILGVFYIVGRYVTSMLSELLSNLGADALPKRMGLGNIMGANQSLSKLLGSLAFFFIMFTGVITAVEKLEFTQLSDILNNVFGMTGQIFFGLIIMVLGNFIATIAHSAVASGGNKFLASLTRITVLGLFLAIALNSMGIATEIVNLAFGLTLGAVAVAVALSFGLGGREAAGKQMEHILRQFRNEDK
ncbi:MAG: mechanosensitive ion channel [Chitinophagales bacterium]